jgi:hypothetical protein
MLRGDNTQTTLGETSSPGPMTVDSSPGPMTYKTTEGAHACQGGVSRQQRVRFSPHSTLSFHSSLFLSLLSSSCGHWSCVENGCRSPDNTGHKSLGLDARKLRQIPPEYYCSSFRCTIGSAQNFWIKGRRLVLAPLSNTLYLRCFCDRKVV